MTNLRDGLNFEEVNQEVTSTAIISGTNVYGSTAVTTPLLSVTTISGTNIVNAEGELQSASIGSGTAVYGAKVQAGSGALSAGSVAWIVYPVAYTGTPSVDVTNMTSISTNGIMVTAGSLNAGSFYVEGETASDEFSWQAIGI